MRQETSTNYKRIAKNSIMLYIRMIITMSISLYTSRVILQVLGVQDFGIYNLVGGIVALFGFISGSLSTATQRFITFEIGKKTEGNISKVFSISLILHILFALFVVLVAEPIGLWFTYNKLVIPADRIIATVWIFQFSIISAFVMMISIPFNALIVAYERMNAFAYISVAEAIMKLAIVFLLLFIAFDKLIVYGALMLIIQLIVITLYMVYCKKHFSNVRFVLQYDKKCYKAISGFAAWSITGNIAYLSYTQGLNILLGMFFQPMVNAARGIAVQIQGVVNTFVLNFQTAINPQITKNYSAGNLNEMHQLVFRSSRFSFYLLLFISMPFLLETKQILQIWLGVVPQYTVIFVRLILITTLINSFANPLIISVKATGKIWQYESVVAFLLLLILPISYWFLFMGFDAWIVFVVHLSIEIIAQVTRVIITGRLIAFSLSYYIRNVLCKILITGASSFTIPFLIYYYIERSVFSLIIISCICIVSTLLCVYFFGLIEDEKSFVNRKICAIVSKNE